MPLTAVGEAVQEMKSVAEEDDSDEEEEEENKKNKEQN